MKVLRLLLRKNRIWVFLSLTAVFCAVAAQLVWTAYIGKLADSIEQRQGMAKGFFVTMGILLAAAAGLQYICQLVNRYTSERLGHSLRMRFAGRILERKSGTEDRMSSYEAMSKVQNELCQASEYMSSTLFNIVWMTLSAVFIIIFLFFQNVILTLTLLTPIIIVMLVVRLQGRKLEPLVHNSMEAKIKPNKEAYSLITNYDAVLVFDGKQFFEERYYQAMEDWGEIETRKERVSAICSSMSGVLSQVPLLLLFAVGALMIWRGSITFGTLIIFLNMQKSVLRTLMNLPSWMISVKSFLVRLDRVEGGKTE